MLIKHEVAPSDAVVAARGLAGVFIARWGGQFLSFPRLETIKARRNHEEILRQYKAGVPCADIATRYGLSYVRIYQIINQHCNEKGIDPPRLKNRKSTLVTLRKRILEVAEVYRGKNNEVCNLLESAAKTVAKAHEVARPIN